MSPSDARPRASIVLLCYGKWHLTEQCLETIADSLGPKLGSEFELVIVDNGSTDETPQRLEEWRDRATVVSLMPNRQFSGGCNAGANAATGEVLIFLNNDVWVRPGVFEELVDEALDPTVGIVGLRLVYDDMTIQHGGVAWFKTENGNFHSFHLFRHEAGDLPAASAPLDLDVVTGACLVIRRELYFRVGGFDEGYRSGFEDVDLCVKVRVAGYRVVYRGDLWLVHDEGLTRGRNSDETHNWHYFHSRWNSLIGSDEAMVAETYDAEFSVMAAGGWEPLTNPWGCDLSIEGQVGGLATESAEARMLLGTFEAAGVATAVREWQLVWVAPKLSVPELELYYGSLRRPKRAGALVVHVPVGGWYRVPDGAADVLRVARFTETPLPRASAIWVPSPDLVEEALAHGFSAEQVDVLPPIVMPGDPGEGGGGVLAVLPGEDLALADELIDALARHGGPQVHVVPTVATPRLLAAVQEKLPHAAVYGPVADERRFAALAAQVDAVLCGSPFDPFDRRALAAAGVGAVPITLRAGVAAFILGDDVVTAGDDLAGAVERALERADRRAARVAAVAETCSPAVLAERLLALRAKAVELRKGRSAVVVP